MSLALSTSWNAFRVSEAEKLVFEIKELGFDTLELSFNLTPEIVSGVDKLVKSREIVVSSVHNFCPIPDGMKREEALPDCYSMSSLDEDERKQSVKFTQRSIDTAEALGAQAVVLHCGRVEIEDKTRELINLFGEGKKDNLEFKRLRIDLVEERSAKANAHLEQTLKSLDTLTGYADRRGIALGVENRFYYREIPCLEEMGRILETFKGSRMGYWHDTGHAQVMENLGLSKHKDYLDSYSKELLGVHLHDLRGCQDHIAPGAGEFDFKKILPYLKKETLKVIEAHSPSSAEDLKKSKAFLESILNDKL